MSGDQAREAEQEAEEAQPDGDDGKTSCHSRHRFRGMPSPTERAERPSLCEPEFVLLIALHAQTPPDLLVHRDRVLLIISRATSDGERMLGSDADHDDVAGARAGSVVLVNTDEVEMDLLCHDLTHSELRGLAVINHVGSR